MSETTKIKWSLGYTYNVGNFESIRVDFQVEDSVRPNETIQKATDRVFNYVDSKLTEKVQEIKDDLG